MPAVSRRAALGATLAVAAGLPSMAVASPDAALIRDCGAYLAAVQDYEMHGGRVDPEDDPRWAALEAARDKVEAAEPLTMAGILAVCSVAHALANLADGTRDYAHSLIGPLPGIVIEGLLRLHGEVV